MVKVLTALGLGWAENARAVGLERALISLNSDVDWLVVAGSADSVLTATQTSDGGDSLSAGLNSAGAGALATAGNTGATGVGIGGLGALTVGVNPLAGTLERATVATLATITNRNAFNKLFLREFRKVAAGDLDPGLNGGGGRESPA